MRRDISIITERKHLNNTGTSRMFRMYQPDPINPFTLRLNQEREELGRVDDLVENQKSLLRSVLAASREARRERAQKKRAAGIKRLDHCAFGTDHWEFRWTDKKYGVTGTFNCFSSRSDAIKQLRRAYNHPDFAGFRDLPVEIVFVPGLARDA
ncbi:hypothetical protein BcepF1.022 [Burkholderia phage BcepF1]|uniref:Uncharacterized protein n=1 Tax=Burkholderia phage BcepF1 TaxID=2886897 RepID=A1YZS6_9CAUD|nr:hypothetical protein BcepF1.022 [Burkholderia phage BcepF1]ABL96753.1 hypothetical protein BcepF1.022 [Burkholderia phage BcepF1]